MNWWAIRYLHAVELYAFASDATQCTSEDKPSRFSVENSFERNLAQPSPLRSLYYLLLKVWVNDLYSSWIL